MPPDYCTTPRRKLQVPAQKSPAAGARGSAAAPFLPLRGGLGRQELPLYKGIQNSYNEEYTVRRYPRHPVPGTRVYLKTP